MALAAGAAAAAGKAFDTPASLDTPLDGPGPTGAAAQDRHMGVATCAGSTCHGAAQPFPGARVLQNEYLTWHRRDRHARAYQTLRGERSRRIAANLGLGAPENEAACLACHADAVPAARRGERFLLADGVGCETCHGPAQRWLTGHVRGYETSGERVAAGMYPTWDPARRAQLCLQCHQGDADHPITHAIMGAGHPPLLFELDTFTVEMPAHHQADADYRRRKPGLDGARLWLAGQAQAARLLLDSLARGADHKGTFPELMLFDCSACHHPMEPPRWEPGRAGTLPPGSVRLADAPLSLIGLALSVLDAAAAAEWRAAVGAVHDASAKSLEDAAAAAVALRKLLEARIGPLAGRHAFSALEIRKLLAALAQSAQGAAGADFGRAELTVMTFAVMHAALAEKESRAVGPQTRAALDALYGTVRSRGAFEPAKYRAAVARLDALMKPVE